MHNDDHEKHQQAGRQHNRELSAVSDGDDQSTALTDRIVDQLGADADNYDGQTMARLNQARQRALAAHGSSMRSRFMQSAWILPFGSIAASALVFALFVVDVRLADYGDGLPVSAERMVAATSSGEADAVIALISDEQDIEFYQRLEFIEWLIESDLDGHVG